MTAKRRVYVPSGMDGYELCHPIKECDFETINTGVRGEPRAQDWKPIAFEICHEDEGKRLLPSDCPWLGSNALIFRGDVAATLGPMLQGVGEFLPLECSEAELVVYNPTQVIAALDEDASALTRFADGRVMVVKSYAFKTALVADLDAFKILNLRVSPTFVSQRFVDLWSANNFKGLEFKCVWESP